MKVKVSLALDELCILKVEVLDGEAEVRNYWHPGLLVITENGGEKVYTVHTCPRQDGQVDVLVVLNTVDSRLKIFDHSMVRLTHLHTHVEHVLNTEGYAHAA